MSSFAVVFEHVHKRYLIRHQKSPYLKDRLTGALSRLNPLREKRVKDTEDFYALRDVSFQIKHGESVGIIGPNGSGKSTTLKILAGVTSPTRGRVAVSGRIGALIEVGAGFHPELTGRENVYLNGSILGMKKSEIKQKFDSIVSFAEVEKFIDTPVKHYSSGMYVRLGFAIAVHNEPDIFLVDEVLSVGDMSFQRKCFERMTELKQSGRTLVFISHSMPQVQSLCDRAIMLNSGSVVADGQPSDVTELYVQQQGGESTKREQPVPPAANIHITGVELLDYAGKPVTRLPPGSGCVLRISYEAAEPVSDAIASVHLSRKGQRIYDTDNGHLHVSLGTLYGSGTLTCKLPPLPLMPNEYDVQVAIFNQHYQIQAHASYPGMLAYSRPGSLAELGCGWISEPGERGIVFAPAAWTSSNGSQPQANQQRGQHAGEPARAVTRSA